MSESVWVSADCTAAWGYRRMQNVTRLLLAREASGKGRGYCNRPAGPLSTQRELERWLETDFVEHCSASYCSFQPAPRSTIALSYNSNGTLLASTHGDHTVKITSCGTGRLVRVLTGHRRTPWVVRFHPRKPNLLASGSLDHEVRLWDASTGQCMTHHTFGKPIASLAFHVSADVLAIACGHKLYIWEYTIPNKLPSIVLKTRRSMRAVHFHPHGQPVVLTAEVQDPSPTTDLSLSLSEAGPYSRTAVLRSQQQAAQHAQQAQQQGNAGKAHQLQQSSRPPPSHDVPIPSPQLLRGAAPAHLQPPQQSAQQRRVYVPTAEGPVQVSPRHFSQEQGSGVAASSHGQQAQQQQPAPSVSLPQGRWTSPFGPIGSGRRQDAASPSLPGNSPAPPQQQHLWPSASPSAASVAALSGMPGAAGSGRTSEEQQQQHAQQRARSPGWVPPGSADLPPSMVPLGWELPFPSSLREPFLPGPSGDGQTEAWGLQGGANPASLPHVMAAFSAAAWNIIGEEQPPRVRLRLWRFDDGKPSAPLESGNNLRLQISDAVLCSEMGVHFSPCGRYLAATTACRAPLPPAVTPTGPAAMVLGASAGDVAAAEREALAAMLVDAPAPRPERAVFEVRVYSIDRNSFGEVLMARRIRAAHCLTSVQFSPTCDHLLLAYGKKHISLLRSLVAERGVVVPLHTILEVFRLSDMDLVRVLPSCEDEINAACFHPAPGGGLAYGTKEGKLRLVMHDRSRLAAEPAGTLAGTLDVPPNGEPEQHPTERDLQGLREWVLTQQWLQQHAVAGAAATGPADVRAAVPGAAAAAAAAVQAGATGQAPQDPQHQPLWELEQRALQVLQQAQQQQAQQAQQQDPAQPR